MLTNDSTRKDFGRGLLYFLFETVHLLSDSFFL